MAQVADWDRASWLAHNRRAVTERVRWLKTKLDGVILVEPTGPHFLVVTKAGSRLRLMLVDQARPASDLIQSHIDLNDPLFLVSPYTQAIMLGLLWVAEPRRVYVAGLGGGRIPLALYHYCPQTVIDCAEIDPAVIRVASRYFALPRDERLRVALDDGREWLARHSPSSPYDWIVVDAYLDNSYTPYRMATIEFMSLCRAHLTEAGVLIVNLMLADPFFAAKVKTIQSVFRQIYTCDVPGGNCVVAASAGEPWDKEHLLRRAAAAQEFHQFPFPFVEHARFVETGKDLCGHLPELEVAPILEDAAPPEGYFDNLPSFTSPLSQTEPANPCPCGSGRRYADCHGRAVRRNPMPD